MIAGTSHSILLFENRWLVFSLISLSFYSAKALDLVRATTIQGSLEMEAGKCRILLHYDEFSRYSKTSHSLMFFHDTFPFKPSHSLGNEACAENIGNIGRGSW